MFSKNSRFLSLIAILILAGILVAGSTTTVSAQAAVTNTADATVLAAITIAATGALEFANVYPGVPKTVARTATGGDTTAAIFTITGEAGAGISAFLVLPEYVSETGGDRMTVSFGTTDMALDTTTTKTPLTVAAGDGWVDQDPRSFPAALVIGGTVPAVTATKVYLGGKCIPSVFQTAGAYTGDIILTVAYNGN